MNKENQNPIYSYRWHGPQRRIGITGGIASGKSSVGAFLKDVKGIPTLDADIYAHEALASNTIATKAVIKRYGKEITSQTQNHPPKINRSLLGRIIFEKPEERLWLEKLIHPIVKKRFHKELIKKKDSSTIAMIIPLLFEANLTGMCSEIWVINCTLNQQYQRLIERDQLTIPEAKQRIESQWPIETKIRLADVVIDNTKNVAAWKRKVDQLC